MIGIIGGTLWGNRGAEAMLVTTIGKIRERYPDQAIVIFSYLPDKDRQLIQDQTIQIFSARPVTLVLVHFLFSVFCAFFSLFRLRVPDKLLPKSVQVLRSCDVLLDISGIAFADGREKFLPFNIMVMLPAWLLRVPVVRLSQAMGSFKNPVNRLCAKFFLPLCDFIFARGRVTAQHLQELGLKNWAVALDIAFLYQPEFSLTNENDDKVAQLEMHLRAWRQAGKHVIGLSPSSVVYAKSIKRGIDYEAQFLQLITSLGSDYHFIFLPNATREGSTTARNNDLFVIDKIRKRASADIQARVLWCDFDINTAGSRRLIALCDALVTSRFHGMISGLSLGIPTAVIGWSHKYWEIMAEFGVEDFAIDFSDAESAVKMIHELIRSRDEIQAQLRQKLPSVQQSSASQFDRLEAYLAAQKSH
ncbi:MAG: hypothetical protein D6711_11095 [Chloroflexi bacterium]|nr:MAG: hypothetical protein D6711_11095 [Chloroflexota bacterium]